VLPLQAPASSATLLPRSALRAENRANTKPHAMIEEGSARVFREDRDLLIMIGAEPSLICTAP
jgi:hypothetical protein